MAVVLALMCAMGSATVQADDGSLPERKTFVPIEDLDAVLAQDKEGVLLQSEEFTELFNAARANADKAPRLPAAPVVSEATYAARIEGDHLLLDATIEFRQFTDGWTQLNFVIANLAIEKATLNGEPARIARSFQQTKGQQQPQANLLLFHNTAGPATLELQLSTQLSSVGNDRAARFQLPAIPSATINVQVPAGRHLQMGSRPLERPAPNDEVATYTVPVGGQRNVLLLFNDHQDEQRTDALTFATTAYGANVAPGEVTWQAKTSLQVFGTTLNQLFCTVPVRLEITDVDSTGLESWLLSDNPDNPQTTLITLNYRQPFDGSREIVFRGVMATPAGEPWAVPELVIRNVTSHIGRVVVQHPPGVRVRLVEALGSRASAGSAGSLVYDVWKEKFSLAFETRTKQRDVHSAVSTVLNLKPDGVTFNGRVQLTPYIAPLFNIKFRLPAEWLVDQISVNNADAAWQVSSREAGWNEYDIPLAAPLPVGQDATFTFRSHREVEDWPVEDNTAEFTLPVVRLPGASVVEGTLVVTAGLDLDLVAAGLLGMDPTVVGEEGERLGFEFQSAEYEGSLTVTRKPSRISAQTLSFTRLDREVLQSHLEATLTITGGGLRELEIGLSESAGDNLRFRLLNSTARIVEQIPAEPADGVRLWKLKLDQRVIGTATLAVDATTARDDAAEFVAHQLTVPAAERINGHVSIEGAPDQQLNLQALDAAQVALSIVDPIDVPNPAQYQPQERIVAAYRYTIPNYTITLSETRFDRVAVPTAVCYRSEIESVLGRTGEMQHRAEFQFVAVGAQSLRVQLPAGETTELWATLIDGQPVEVRSTRGSYLVPIPAGQPEAQRTLTLFYRTQVPPLKQAGTIEQQPPHVTVLHSAGAEQRLEILDQHWELTYPNGTDLTSSSGAFSPVDELSSYSLLGALREDFTRLNPRRLANNGLIAFAILVIVGVIGFILRRQGVSALGCLGATIATVVLLIALMLPAVQSSRDSPLSARYDNTAGDVFAPAADSVASVEVTSEFGFNDESDDADGEATVLWDSENSESLAGIADMAPSDEPMPPAAAPPAEPMPTSSDVNPPPGARITRLPGESIRGSDGGEAALHSIEADARNPFIEQDVLVDVGGIAQLENLPQQPGDAKRVRRKFRGAQPRGLLSLSLQLQQPEDAWSHKFRYTGNRNAADGTGLQIAFQDRDAGDYGRVFLMVAVSLFLWVMLGATVQTRAVLAILGVSVPVALVSVAPLAIHPVLDGVFLGAVLSLALWLLRAVYRFIRRPNCVDRIKRTVASAKTQAATSATVLLIVSSSFTGSVQAADQPQGAQSVIEQTDQPAAQSDVPQARTNQVLVPYDPNSGGPLKADRVLLTREQFLRLWNLAHPDQKVQPKSNRTGVVSDSFYECRIKAGNDQAVSVQATLILHSFQDHQIPLRVPLGQVALESATLDGKPASLKVDTGKGRNGLIVLVDSPGQHTLDLKFDVPAAVNGSVGQFRLPVDVVPSGRAVFHLPEPGLSIRVNGSTSAYRLVTAADDSQLIQIPIDAREAITIAWRPPEQLGMVDSIVHVDSATKVKIDDAGVTEFSRISIRVPQGAIADLSFDIPSGLRIQRITGPHLAGWGFNDENDQRRLRVFFSPPVTEATLLNVQLFLDQQIDAEAAINLPIITPLEVTREIGLIGVVAPDSLTIRSGDVSGLVQVNVSGNLPLPRANNAVPLTRSQKLAAQAAEQPRLAWRYTSRPFELNLNVVRQRPESTASVEHAATVGSRKIVVDSFVRASLRGSPRTALTFELADEFLVLNVDATSLADWYVSESDGLNPRTLTVEFTQPLIGDVDVVLKGQTARDPDPFVLVDLPRALELSGRTTWAGVWFDEAFDATAEVTDGWKSIAPDDVPARLRNFDPRPLEFAYKATEDGPNPLGFQLQRAIPETSADAVVMVSASDTFLDYSLALNWTIRDAAIDQFTFTTPLWLKDRLNFIGASIREVRSETTGETLQWTIHLHNAVRGRYFVLATAIMPPATARVETPAVQFLQPRFNEFGEAMGFELVESQRLYALLINQSQSQLISEHGDSIEVVSADAIPIRLDQEILDQAAELLRIRDANALPAWGVRRLQQTTGAAASVNVADLTLAIAQDGSWRCQAVYTIRNRRRQFLPVRLPAESKLLSLYVQGRPSRPVQTQIDGDAVQLIPLPRTSDAEGSFQVKLVCTGAFPRSLPTGFLAPTTALDLPSPRVINTAESAEFGIPVARTVWTVHVPDGVDATLLHDPARTNVTESAIAAARTAYVSSSLMDGSGWLSVLKGKGYSAKQKRTAANNLKNQSYVLNRFQTESGDGTPDKHLNAQVSQQRQEIDANREAIDRYTTVIDGSSSTILNSELDSNDPTAQRGQVTRNQLNLILSNSGSIAQSEDLNTNGQLDPGEDFNGNGILDFVTEDSAVWERNNKGGGEPTDGPMGAEAPVTQNFENSFEVEIKAGTTSHKFTSDEEEPNTKSKPSPQKKSVSRSARQGQSRSNYAGLNELSSEEGEQMERRPSSGNGDQPSYGFALPSPGQPSAAGGVGGGFGGGGQQGMQQGQQGRQFSGNMFNGQVPTDFGEGEIGSGRGRNAGDRERMNAPTSGRYTGQGIPAERRHGFSFFDQRGSSLAQTTDGDVRDLYGDSGQQLTSPAWTRVGGLSLPVDIPTPGNELRFSKVSGQPRLALTIRSREVVSKGVGLIWTAVWIGIGIFLVSAFRKVRRPADVWQPASWVLLTGGLICFLTLPGGFTGLAGLSGLGFLCFGIGWLIIVTRYVRNGRKATA